MGGPLPGCVGATCVELRHTRPIHPSTHSCPRRWPLRLCLLLHLLRRMLALLQLLSEVWVTIWSMLAGASCYAGIIGSISAMMLNMDASGSRYLSRLDEMTQYMRDNDLPAALRDRVRGYFEQRWQQRKMFSEEELLALLPTSMEKVCVVHV